jgi:hypothetical protein
MPDDDDQPDLDWHDVSWPAIQSIPAGARGKLRGKPRRLRPYRVKGRTADLMCRRRARSQLGVVLAGSLVETTEGVSEEVGKDFYADCRGCGTAHAIDGGKLRSAVMALPMTTRRRVPLIWVDEVERVGPSFRKQEP